MSRTLLIVDDNIINRAVLIRALRDEYDFLEAGDGLAALSIIEQRHKTLSAVLLDINMPVMDGFEVLRRIRANPLLAQLPVIVVTGSEDEQTRIKALEFGANDFATKPYNPEIIKHCLHNNIALHETASMINSIQRDALTGVYNREFFFEKAGELIASHESGYYILACLDIDNFKLVNDQYGTAEGDRILRHIGAELMRAFESVGGVCGRISGDNFAGLYPNTPETVALMTMSQQRVLMPESSPESLFFSVGRYVVDDKSLPVSAIYDRAYIAKQTIKGRYDEHIRYFDDSLLEDLVREQEIVREMSAALASRQFEVWLQPQYNHASGALIGAEALVRWRHPEKGLVAPGFFIPVFERNGFIYELDKYVWEESCRLVAEWTASGLRPLPVSVNISRYDVFRAGLADYIYGLTRKYGIPVDLLRVEITESAFAKSAEQIISVVKRFIELGFTVEIDDFGSGYSSLNTLKDVPAQVLKLDMKFLEASDSSPRGGNILESIVRMANWLGMSIIAEGVETQAQADFLKSIGCCCIQGYLYARPMPSPEYESLLAAAKDEPQRPVDEKSIFERNAFWDPESLDTLMFNSFVGAACVIEFHAGEAEILRVSGSYTRELGIEYDPSEPLSVLDPYNYLDGEGKRLLGGIVIDAILTSEEKACEFKMSDSTGRLKSAVYIRCTARVIARAGDRFLMYCIFHNITAQREAEAKELETAERMKAIMANLSAGVVIARTSGERLEILYSNDRYFELFGYSREEYMREFGTGLDPILDEDARWALPIIKSVMETGERREFDFRARHRDGRLIWLKDRVVRFEGGGFGEPVHLSLLYDVTEEREAEERLRQSEAEMRLAVSHSGNTLCRFIISERTLTMAPSVAARLGVPPRLDDVPFGQIRSGEVSPESQSAYISFFESITRGGMNGVGQYQFKTPNGWRWMEAHYSNIFDAMGKPAFAVVSFFDVTDRIEKEAVYKKWQQSLKNRQPGSYSLFRCNLNKNASYDTAEGELIRGIFDSEVLDFNERAQSYCSERVFPEDREEYLAFANADVMLADYYRGRRMKSLEYRELLKDGSLRWLRLTVELVEHPTSTDIEAYLLYEDIDREKKEGLETELQAQRDPLTGLLNRKTFTERLSAQLTGASGAVFIIDLDRFKQINDSFGHAVGDETLIEIGRKLRSVFRAEDLICRLGGDEFMAFIAGTADESALTDKASHICAALRRQYSAEIQLSASVGIALFPADGQDFTTLYRKADAALYHIKRAGKDGYAFYTKDMDAAQKPSGAVSEITALARPQRRMLIVDDNELNLDLLTGLFENEFIIDTATDGEAALELLSSYGEAIAVVLLDLMMPGMDGFTVLRQMHTNFTMQSIPVIVVSGMNGRETALEAIRQGAADFVTKPVDADLLRLRVASAISKAENERLRAQNRYLAIQNEESRRLAEARRHSEELSAALHAAEQADYAKGLFLSSMSHEIRTPLNAIIGFNTLARNELRDAVTDAERRRADTRVLDCLTKSEIASRHLLTIINDVLDMSAIESGKLKLDSAPFNFRSLITSLTVMFFSQAKAKGVRFEVLLDKPTDEWFTGDQMRINQILTNLLSNAVKFTPEGGAVTLTIKEHDADAEAAGFTFSVEDTGIGMSEEYLSHIWTPFEQEEASISRRFGGTGLGLSITKRLVDLMNGDIDVKSTQGSGSRFTVRLTLGRTEQPAAGSLRDFTGISALVVDDDPAACDYIKLLFDRCGAHCDVFTGGESALEAFAAAKEAGAPYNVCLVDWSMPGMDGFETITELRRIAAEKLPIVVITTYDLDEIEDRAERLGVYRFISKPLFQSSLFDLLSDISGSQSEKEPKAHPKVNFGGARVLLVEDNSMNMEVARRILLSAGLRVDCAWNGREAVDAFLKLKPGSYSAILMDVNMPELDGYQATRLIRESGRPDAGSVPIIAMTADAFAGDVNAALDAGMNAHISKPIDVDTLFSTLSAHITGGGEDI